MGCVGVVGGCCEVSGAGCGGVCWVWGRAGFESMAACGTAGRGPGVSMGRRGGRRAVVVVWRATSGAGAGSICVRSARASRVCAIVAI